MRPVEQRRPDRAALTVMEVPELDGLDLVYASVAWAAIVLVLRRRVRDFYRRGVSRRHEEKPLTHYLDKA